MANPTLQIYPTKPALYTAMADFFLQQAQTAISQKNQFVIAISGGNSPLPLYELLKGPHYAPKIPWEKLFIFWADERFVPPDSAQNNAHCAFQAWLNAVPIPKDHIFPISILKSAAESAAAYEKTLHNFFNQRAPTFDLIMLGLGDNAHTASLFPHTDVLKEHEKWVAPVDVQELKMSRITLTPVIINQAECIAFLVEGNNKAKAVQQTLRGPHNPAEIPAQLIQPDHGKLIWFLDNSAATFII